MKIVVGERYVARVGGRFATVIRAVVDGEVIYTCSGHEYKVPSSEFSVAWEPCPVELKQVARDQDEVLVPTVANPKQAYGDKKCALQLVPPALMIGAAKAFKEGAAKYGPFNWRHNKVEAMTYVGGFARHMAAYLDGEDVDPESTTGKLHLEGAAACIGILLDAHYGGFLIDNRPPAGPAPRLILTPKDPPK
jgi:hypothetical protein